MKIAVLDDYQRVARDMADWSGLEANHTVQFFHEPFADQAAVTAALKDYDVLAIMRERTLFDRTTLDGLPNLKLMATSGMRNAAIDLAALAERGIPCVGTGGPVQSTPELAWGLILAVARNIPTEDRNMRTGAWQQTVGMGLEGRTLGIIGLGRLGKEMARIGQAFRMNIIAWSQNLTADAAAEVGVSHVEKDELFRQADVISIHHKLSPRSAGLVGAREVGLMKPTAILVNTSRGPIVDMAALTAALKENRIGGAGIDVYDTEPVLKDDPIRSCPRTVLMPHMGYVTDNTYRQFYGETVQNIEAWLAGTPTRVIQP